MGDTSMYVTGAILAVFTTVVFMALWLMDATRANSIEHDRSRLDTTADPTIPLHSYAVPPMPTAEQDFDGGLGWWGHRVERLRPRR